MLKIGLIREGKTPPDARVALTPEQCVAAMKLFPELEIVAEPSQVRAFKDEEYAAAGVRIQADISDCDVLLGIKEVPVAQLIPDKHYFFFSHTMKKQPYNRGLLQAVLEKNIRLTDYEALVDEQGVRLIAFGYYAGVVGAYNGIWAYGARCGAYKLPRMCEMHDYAAVMAAFQSVKLPPIRIVLTGSGRVSSGALKTLRDMRIREVTVRDFIHETYDEAVFTQVTAQDYALHKNRQIGFDKTHYYAHGDEYKSNFAPLYRSADIMINGIYYDKKAPAFFTREEMARPDFRIRMIADITCDIAPGASVPSTIRSSTIAAPIYGYNPFTGEECAVGADACIDVMAVDNLPSELPRDASSFFGDQFIHQILPELMRDATGTVISRGTIAANGCLSERFAYLKDYVHETAGLLPKI